MGITILVVVVTVVRVRMILVIVIVFIPARHWRNHFYFHLKDKYKIISRYSKSSDDANAPKKFAKICYKIPKRT